MFSNIGGKIKILAVTIAIIGMVAGGVWFAVSATTYSENAEFLEYADLSYAYQYSSLYERGMAAYTARAGMKWSAVLFISSLISSWPMYGFGQLVENSDKLVALYQGKVVDDSSVEDDLPNI